MVLKEFTSFRNPDAQAICDLAMHNYIEVLSYRVEGLFGAGHNNMLSLITNLKLCGIDSPA